MASSQCERAIAEAQRAGKALLKFISPNDAGATRSHQWGYLLPKAAWSLFTPHAPVKGENRKSNVRVVWQNGLQTESCVTWYGKAKEEYRLTGFGRDFPFRTNDNVGDLLVLILESLQEFRGYVLDLEGDIDEIQAELGVEILDKSAVYDRDALPPIETQDACIRRELRKIIDAIETFPETARLSAEARRAVGACVRALEAKSADERLMLWHDTEYALFQMVERKVYSPEIGGRMFRSVDEFLATANRILNRRKSRAGRALENHIDQLLTDEGVPHTMRPMDIEGQPDIVIPGREEYLDPAYPTEKLIVIGVKSTCKDRWPQVLQEAPRVTTRHILTIQKGISASQLRKMGAAGVRLIVPERFHEYYPAASCAQVLNVEEFIEEVRAKLA